MVHGRPVLPGSRVSNSTDLEGKERISISGVTGGGVGEVIPRQPETSAVSLQVPQSKHDVMQKPQ